MSWLSSLTSDLTTTISSAVEEVVQHLPSASDLSPDGLEDENDPKEKDDQETAGREKGKQEKPSGDSLPLSSAMSSFFDTSIVSNFKPSDIVQSIDAIAASVVAPLASDHKNITLEQNRTARKEHEFDRMLPWETDEEEKEILCPEVREVILKFGSSRTVFEGPFRMSSGAMCIAEEADEKQDGEEEVVFQEEEKVIDEVDAILKDTTKEKDEKEIEELYFPFDLDSHLGLIRRMMEIDEHLVAAHSKWCSGGGEREVVFWRNYFYHCARAREASGLSTAEIWGEDLFARKKREDDTLAGDHERDGEIMKLPSEIRESNGNGIDSSLEKIPSDYSRELSEDYDMVNKDEGEGEDEVDNKAKNKEDIVVPVAGEVEKDIEDLEAEIERELNM